MYFICEVCGVDDIDYVVKYFIVVYFYFIDFDCIFIVDGVIGTLCRSCDVFESVMFKFFFDV